MARSIPKSLPTVAPALPRRCFGGGVRRRGLTGSVARFGVGPNFSGRRLQGRRGSPPEQSARAQPACRIRSHALPGRASPGRRVESERAAARQNDRVNLLDSVDWVEQIGLARAEPRRGHRLPRPRPPRTGSRAAGWTAGISEVADFDSGDVSDRAAFILDKRIQTSWRIPCPTDVREWGSGEAAPQNVASRCFSHKGGDIRPPSRSGYYGTIRWQRRLEPAGSNRLRFWFRRWSAHG